MEPACFEERHQSAKSGNLPVNSYFVIEDKPGAGWTVQ